MSRSSGPVGTGGMSFHVVFIVTTIGGIGEEAATVEVRKMSMDWHFSSAVFEISEKRYPGARSAANRGSLC